MPLRDLVMSHHSRTLSRRRAIALSAVGIGSWSGDAKATDAISLKIGSTTMDVSFVTGNLDLSRSALLDWISVAAHAVRVYYGRFPVLRAMIEVRPAAGKAGVLEGLPTGHRREPESRSVNLPTPNN
jgi:hypothetical protein